MADEELVVFTAKKIITMDPSTPTATAVAIRGDTIVSVGTLDSLRPWLDAHPHRIDEQFKDKFLLPGLIDPHLHPLLGAIQFGTKWLTPEAWNLHDDNVPAVTTQDEYRSELKDAIAESKGDGKPIFITWGWSEPTHGPITRAYLDQIESEKPVMILQRSVHEAVFNTAALEYMGLVEEDLEGYSETEANWETGHFVEAGMFRLAVPRLAAYLMAPDYIDPGYERNAEYLTWTGITTAGDMLTGGTDWDLEIAAMDRNLVDKKVPFRTVIVPGAIYLALAKGGLDESFKFVDQEMSRSDAPPQLVYGKRVKLLIDGAMFSLLGMTLPPGYIDGHSGEWITYPDEFVAQAEKYWKAGYRVHVHANGDMGIKLTLDVFEQLQAEFPRGPNSLVFEHFGLSNATLNRRVADLNASVSANPYYVHALGDVYAEIGVGYDRARNITPMGSLVDLGVPVALHSDFGMAPAHPMYLAWSAITRETASGKVFAPPRGLTRQEALRAITIDAAYILGLDHKLGSIQAGKTADFSIFDEDPTTVPIERLKELNAWGVVFEGEIHEAVKKR